MLIDTACSKQRTPDQQIPGRLLAPRERGEENAADDLRAGDDHHGAEHDDDHDFHEFVQQIAEFMNAMND